MPGSDDANRVLGKYVCSRYGCSATGTEATPLGAQCGEHASSLMFSIQRPWELRRTPDGVPFEIPWEFIAPHDWQARRNHGGQTLARLSERGGLALSEVIAVLEGRPWREMDRASAKARLLDLLDEWRRSSTLKGSADV